MCYGLIPAKRKSVIGYKVVAKKKNDDKNYYSIAVGIRYPLTDTERLPRCNQQNKIGSYFCDGILRQDSCTYVQELQGKTSVFLRLKGAKRLYEVIKMENILISYSYIIVKVKITGNIYLGFYGDGIKIMAGERMEFLKEYN